MMTDLSTLPVDALVKKLAWYKARSTSTCIAMTEKLTAELKARVASTSRSVVAKGYKDRYAAKGNARNCGDWLADALTASTLAHDGTLLVAKFEAIMDENGLVHQHWNRTSPGWQGRMRMSGSLMLRRLAKAQGFVVIEGRKVTR